MVYWFSFAQDEENVVNYGMTVTVKTALNVQPTHTDVIRIFMYFDIQPIQAYQFYLLLTV